MAEISSTERERQRVEHLVLGRPRPKLSDLQLSRPKGMSRSDWKVRRDTLRREALTLAPDVERGVQLREAFGGRKATPETLEHAGRARRRAGSLARLHGSGTISADQLAAAQEIAEAYEAIGAEVAIKSASLEARVDCSAMPGQAFDRLRASDHRQLAYSRWRRAVERPALVLAIVVEDVGLTLAARTHRVSDRRARALLSDALDAWIKLRGRRGR